MSQALPTEKDSLAAGMPPAQIKGLIVLRQETIDLVALAIEESPRRVSDTVNRNRPNRRIREKLSKHLNISYETLWGEAPREKAESETTVAVA